MVSVIKNCCSCDAFEVLADKNKSNKLRLWCLTSWLKFIIWKKQRHSLTSLSSDNLMLGLILPLIIQKPICYERRTRVNPRRLHHLSYLKKGCDSWISEETLNIDKSLSYYRTFCVKFDQLFNSASTKLSIAFCFIRTWHNIVVYIADLFCSCLLFSLNYLVTSDVFFLIWAEIG